MSNTDRILSDFEIITSDEVVNPSRPTTPENSPTPENSTPDNPAPINTAQESPAQEKPAAEEPTITKSDLSNLYKFSTTLVDQHNDALQTIRSYETEKFLTHLSIKDLITKQDSLLALCNRLAKAHSLDEPVGIPEEGILSYMLDCIENLQQPLDAIGEKIEAVEEKIEDKIGDVEEKMDDLIENMGNFEDHVVDHVVRVEMIVEKKAGSEETFNSLSQIAKKMDQKPESKEEILLGLCREILGRVTYLEDALLHGSDDDFGFINHHQEGILGCLSDEIFNLVNQVGNFEGSLQGIVDGVEGTLQEFIEGPLDAIIAEQVSVLHPRGDSPLPESSKILEIQADIRKQLLGAERSLKSTFLNFQEKINQRLDDLEGRFESLGTLKPSKETMSDFEKAMLAGASRGRSEPPASLFNFGNRVGNNPGMTFPETPRSTLRKQHPPNKPSSSKGVSPAKLQPPPINFLPISKSPISGPSEQPLPKKNKGSSYGKKRGPSQSPEFDREGELFKYANTPQRPSTQKALPPFLPPSKSTPSTQATTKVPLVLHQAASSLSDLADRNDFNDYAPKNPFNNPIDSPLARKMKSLSERKKKTPVSLENNSMTTAPTTNTTSEPTTPTKSQSPQTAHPTTRLNTARPLRWSPSMAEKKN